MHTFTVYVRLIHALVRSQLQYRVSFLMDLIATTFYTVLEFASLVLILGRIKTLGSWTIPEITLLYGLAELSFGIMDMAFAGFDPSIFGAFIRQGSLDQLMLRPVSLTVQVMGSDFGLRRLGKCLLGLVILLYGIWYAGIIWTPEKALLLLLVLIGMVLFFAGLFMIGSTITFWTVDSAEAMNILTYGGRAMIEYPMSIYQNWLRKIFTFVVPVIFLNYYPVLHLLDKPDPFGFPAWSHWLSPVVGCGIFLLAILFWRFGLKHYQSTGT
ncbi:ABC transporter permease [Deinococcus roseus]|uniref:ABC transporter permease n=1 Tax=Deinococcus roseus TaxID=392414 RepID=A0ABQ2D7A4_9DEIO|nr:ABC-2 family transporter protein [Deinococcus roseus]GGJ48550.1 ABC transporter permease [Deinococcus roseus]